MAKKKKVEDGAETVEATEKKGRGGAKGPRGIDRDAIINILVAENPKRKGKAAYDRFDLYVTGMTVGDALAKGVTTGDLHFDVAKGFISIG